MNAAERYHRRLKWAGLCLAGLAAISLFACELQEWLIYFDPFPARFLLWPAYLATPLLPFLVVLDRTSGAMSGNRIRLGVATVAVFSSAVLWWILIGVGTFCRGPFMNFHWPWEERLPKLDVLSRANLSELFWRNWLDGPTPADPLLRESPGLTLLAIWLVAVPALAALLLKRRSPQMATWRSLAFIGIVQVAALLPIKMALRWAVNLKYIVAFPEQLVNL